ISPADELNHPQKQVNPLFVAWLAAINRFIDCMEAQNRSIGPALDIQGKPEVRRRKRRRMDHFDSKGAIAASGKSRRFAIAITSRRPTIAAAGTGLLGGSPETGH
ncbi:MAG: hypothetical protein IOC58_10040, partial [Methylobacterium sp.]|nr:hypothetical protein [Methylobacterium sp.]